MQASIKQTQSVNELLEELKIYEMREKAFKVHLKIKDNEIHQLEKEIKKLRGDINQSGNDDEEESNSGNSGEDIVKEKNEQEDENLSIDPYLNEYITTLIEIIKYKNKESQEKNKSLEQSQALESNNSAKQVFKKCRELVKENLELYNEFEVGILENLKFENGLEKTQIEQLMIKLKALEQYQNELEHEITENNEKINLSFEKMC